jgi:hypothetical protein
LADFEDGGGAVSGATLALAVNSGELDLVVSTVNTNPTNIVFSVTGGNLNLSWPADHIGWRLLVQTNNLASGISLNTSDWETLTGSRITNLESIPVDPAKPAEFYQLIYP